MILHQELSHDAEFIGDIQENRVGIDRNNIDFITTLLTSNLYSKPLESFFRETVANAYDSHVEAGTTEPILILIEDVKDKYRRYRVSIRDYGTGLSPERFQKIYTNIGSSTKRESNDYIGMFGIGRFSCLACADVANVTSYFGGKKYSYIMYKNGGGINIDKISETEGDFKNGLEISVECDAPNHDDFRKAFIGISLFDKVHIVYKGDTYSVKFAVEDFNSRNVTHYKTFSRCSLISPYHSYLKVGNVLYIGEDIKNLYTSGIIVDLPMGEVDITPNREKLQYTTRTQNVIATQILKIKQELSDLVAAKVKSNLSLEDFARSVYESHFPVDNMEVDKRDIKLDYSSITIDGEPIPAAYENFLRTTRYFKVPKDLIYKATDGPRFTTRDYEYTIANLVVNKFCLFEKADKIIKKITADYFLSTQGRTDISVILVPEGLQEFKTELKQYLDKEHPTWFAYGDASKCIDFTFRHLTVKTLSNDSVPQTFVNDYKQPSHKKSLTSNEVAVRFYRGDGSYCVLSFKNIPSSGLIVYSSHTREDELLRGVAGALTTVSGFGGLITVKAEHLSLFQNNRRFIPLDNFLYLENKMLRKYVTGFIIEKNFRDLMEAYEVNLCSTPIYREFRHKYPDPNRYGVWCENAKEMRDSICKYYEERGWVNTWDVNAFSLTEKDVKGYKGWKELTSRRDCIVKMCAVKKYGVAPKIGLSGVNCN